MSNQSAECSNFQSTGQSGGELGINVSMRTIPEDIETYIGISKSGYLFVNILGSMNVFNIGEEKINAFIDYVFENGQGKEIP